MPKIDLLPCPFCGRTDKSYAMSRTVSFVPTNTLEYQNANTCVCCGKIIPEGTQLCHKCQKGD